MSALEDAARRVEALQQASGARSAASDDALRARDGPCALREVLGAKQLPTDGTGEQIVRTLRRAANAEPTREKARQRWPAEAEGSGRKITARKLNRRPLLSERKSYANAACAAASRATGTRYGEHDT